MRYMLLLVCLGLLSSCTGPVGLRDHAVFDAAEKGDLPQVQRLVRENPAIVNSYRIFRQPKKPGRTDAFPPLYLACLYGRYEVARFLLDSGADVNADTGAGWTPLHEACSTQLHDDPRIVKLLIARGADVQAKWDNDVFFERSFALQPIHLASRSGRLAAVKALITAGANPAALDGEGKNALNHALAFQRPEVAKYLRDDLDLSPATNTTEIGLSPIGQSMQGVCASAAGETADLIEQILREQNAPADANKQPTRRLRGGISPPCDKDGRKPLLDQAQLVYNGGLSARTLSGYSHWQSFTPSISGQLMQIDIGFFTKMRGDGTLALYSGKGIKGDLLCSVPVPVVAGERGGSWNSYSLSAVVSAGRQYTFHFIPNPLTLPDPYGVCVGAKASLYTRGTFAIVDPSGEYTLSSQSVFRTYVIPKASQPDRKVTPGKSVQSSTKTFEAKK